MARKPYVKLPPRSSLSDEQLAKRRLARKLGLKDERRLDAWLRKHRSLPSSDIRHIRADLPDDDFTQLNRIRNAARKFKTPEARLLEKKRILIDTADVANHMSAFAFLERYREQIEALLRDAGVSKYQKNKLKEMLKDLQGNIHKGDIGTPRQVDLWNRYNGREYAT